MPAGPLDGLRSALSNSKIMMCLTHGEYDLMNPLTTIKIPANVYVLEESGIGEVAQTSGDRVLWETMQNRKDLIRHLTASNQYFLRNVKQANLNARKSMFNNSSFRVYLPGDKMINRSLILTPSEERFWNWGYFEFDPAKPKLAFPPDVLAEIEGGFSTRRQRDQIMQNFGQSPQMQDMRERHYDGRFAEGYCTSADVIKIASEAAKGVPIIILFSSCAVWNGNADEALKAPKGDLPKQICQRSTDILTFQQAHKLSYYKLLGLKELPSQDIMLYDKSKTPLQKHTIKTLIEYFNSLSNEYMNLSTSKRRKKEIDTILTSTFIHSGDKQWSPFGAFMKTYLEEYPAFVETDETFLLNYIRLHGCEDISRVLKSYREQLAANASSGEEEEEEEEGGPANSSKIYMCFFNKGRAAAPTPFINPARGDNNWTHYDILVTKRALIEKACSEGMNPYYVEGKAAKSLCEMLKKKDGGGQRGGFLINPSLAQSLVDSNISPVSTDFFKWAGNYIIANSEISILTLSSLSGLLFKVKMKDGVNLPFFKFSNTANGYVPVKTFIMKASLLSQPITSYTVKYKRISHSKDTDRIGDFSNECHAQFEMYDKTVHTECIIPSCISDQPVVIDSRDVDTFLETLKGKMGPKDDQAAIELLRGAAAGIGANLGYFIMEFAEGYSILRETKGQGALDAARAAILILALIYKVTHGDIHDGNIMVKQDASQMQFVAAGVYSVKVIDFGRYMPIRTKFPLLDISKLDELAAAARQGKSMTGEQRAFVLDLFQTKLGDDKYKAKATDYREWLRTPAVDLDTIWTLVKGYFVSEQYFYSAISSNFPGLALPKRPNSAGGPPKYLRVRDLNNLFIERTVEESKAALAKLAKEGKAKGNAAVDKAEASVSLYKNTISVDKEIFDQEKASRDAMKKKYESFSGDFQAGIEYLSAYDECNRLLSGFTPTKEMKSKKYTLVDLFNALKQITKGDLNSLIYLTRIGLDLNGVNDKRETPLIVLLNNLKEVHGGSKETVKKYLVAIMILCWAGAKPYQYNVWIGNIYRKSAYRFFYEEVTPTFDEATNYKIFMALTRDSGNKLRAYEFAGGGTRKKRKYNKKSMKMR